MNGSNVTTANNLTTTIFQLPTEQIMPNRSQPRQNFENDTLWRLAESIKRYGILQPLTVRKSNDSSKFSIFQYELIAGERRLRASRLLGFPTVPCIIIETDNQTSAAMAIIENLHRDDLNIFEQASAIASLIDMHKLTQEQIASQLSLTQSAIANKLRLLKLTDAERAVILENQLTERHARALLRIKPPTTRIETLAHIVKHNFNVKQTEDYIENLITPETQEKTTRVKITDYKILISYIKRIVENTRTSGFNIKTAQTETDSNIVYTISIPKNSNLD